MMSFVKSSFCCLAAFLFASSLFAQTTTNWIVQDGLWGDPASWDNGIPVGNFVANIGNSGGEVVHDIEVHTLFELNLNGDENVTNLLLDEALTVMNFSWDGGVIGGPGMFTLLDYGEVSNGILNTDVANFGHVTFGADGSFANLDNEVPVSWINMPGSVMDIDGGILVGNFTNPVVGQITNLVDSKMCLFGPSAQFNWNVSNLGTIEINSIVLFLGDFAQISSGRLDLKGGTADFFNNVFFEGELTGEGSVLNMGGAEISGTIAPGNSEIGFMQFGGGPVMNELTVTNLQIGPNNVADEISNLGGGMQLDGTLNVEALEGATPGTYQLFTFNNGFQFENNLELGRLPIGFVGNLFTDLASMSVNLQVDQLDSVRQVDDFALIRGQLKNGDIDSLVSADSDSIEIGSVPFVNRPKGRSLAVIELEAALDGENLSALTMRIESSGSVPMRQRVELFNFDSNEFEQVSDFGISPVEQLNDIRASGDVNRYVDSENLVRARISFQPNLPQANSWSAELNQVHFAIR